MSKAFWVLALTGIMITWGASRRREKPEREDYTGLLKLAGLAEYKPPENTRRKDKEDEEEKVPRKSSLISTGETELGPFVVKVDRRPKTCSVKLYENLDEGRRLLGTWSGDVALCKDKRALVIAAVEQVRAERRGVIIPESLKITAPKPPKLSPVPTIPASIPASIPRVQEYDIVLSGITQNKKPYNLSRGREIARALSMGVGGEKVHLTPLHAGLPGLIETYIRGQARETLARTGPVLPMSKVRSMPEPEPQKEVLREKPDEPNVAMMKLIRDTPGLTDEQRMNLLGHLK